MELRTQLDLLLLIADIEPKLQRKIQRIEHLDIISDAYLQYRLN